jgi:HEAT repeats
MSAKRPSIACAIIMAVSLAAADFSHRQANAEPPQPVAANLRPIVCAVLQGGERIEGLLERFDDGVYWLLSGAERKTFAERDLASISFRPVAGSAFASAEDAELARLIEEFFRPTGHHRQRAHPALIPKLAAFGPRAIRPLLAAFQRHDDDYQAVGQVLHQMGPEVFPMLIESVREDSGRSARFPVWWALRESGVNHAPFIQQMLKDKDPRIRQLAMEVLHSWSITSGVALPATLDLALIQALDDPDEDVRKQAPLILGRIGFNSELVFPILLRTLHDENYASVRSKSVIALGHLGRDLKVTDPTFTRLVEALARTVTADPSQNVRGSAAYYLGGLGPHAAAAIPALRQATDDKKESVRSKAVEALQKIEDER